jgi:hypothetical protein
VQEVEVMAAGPSREGALATQNGTAMIDPATQQPIVGAVATMSHRKFVIRWMSSVVLRQSMVRQMQLKGLLNQNSGSGPSQPLDSYRIMLSGSPDQYAGLTENVLQQSTYLETAPTGQKIFPTSVVISPASIDFSFPREMEGKPTIPDKQTRAKFHCKLKTATVHADFDLRKMVYQGHPDL